MSWLIVAKMPLLISSRMMSATLTVSSSASSLTVMVPGSSIAPRSLGSIVWTCDASPPSRRGGLRGPRRPRVPLLLLATGSSLCGVRRDRSRCHGLEERGRERDLERPCEGALLDGEVEAGRPLAHVGATAGEPSRWVQDDVTLGSADHALQLALRTRGPTGHAH